MADKVRELSEAELAAVMAAILQITGSKNLTEFETQHPPPPSNGMKPMPSRGFRGKTMTVKRGTCLTRTLQLESYRNCLAAAIGL